MSTATITSVTPVTARVAPEVRRRTGRARLAARWLGLSAPSRLRRLRRSASYGAVVPGRGAGDRREWRLTDRGIAVVLVLALMITVAAVVVIGLTAWQVTGADYGTWSAETVGAVTTMVRTILSAKVCRFSSHNGQR